MKAPSKKQMIGGLAGSAAAVGAVASGLISLESVQSIADDVLKTEITRYTIAFILAWKIVKRDFSKEFEKLTSAVNHLGERFDKLVGRVEALEKQGGKK